MKKFILVFFLIFGFSSNSLAAQEPAVLYHARLIKAAPLKEQPDKTLKHLTIISEKDKIDILELYPDWLLIRSSKGEIGYIQRRYIDFNRVEPADPATIPQYPAITSEYVSQVEKTTAVRKAPDTSADAIITLNPGAKLAIIGIENGWAKVIYHRQYAYVDTRHLNELLPVSPSAQSANGTSPIAAYTSFYRLSTDENNLNRIFNISVANEKMQPIVIQPGETFDFNRDVGPYNKRSGYLPAITLVDGGTALGYGGGTCQVSSTLYNTLLQLPGLSVEQRRPHGPGGASYLPLHADAAVGNPVINLIFRNLYPYPVRIDATAQDGALTILIWPAQGPDI